MRDIDCVVIGYNEGRFVDYGTMSKRAGTFSPEWQIYRKEHIVIDETPMPWMDAFSTLRNKAVGRNDRYHVGEVYNLASVYLTSHLRRHGIDAVAISLFGNERDRLRSLLATRPKVVAITSTFYVNILPVLPIVQFVREHSPESHIVVGGPLIDNFARDGVSNDLQDMLFAIGADSYVLEAQGEATLVSLYQAISARVSLANVNNVIRCEEGNWILSERVLESNSLDECRIRWADFAVDHEIGVTAQMRTARSCAFKCSFCDYPSRAGALTVASVDTVRQEIRELAALGVKNLVFVDDTFNVPPKRFKALCEMMIEEDLGLSWYSYFRCSNAKDDETFDVAAASGCKGVFLGIESADPVILKNMNKLAQDDQYRDGIARLKERGITTFASIIVGFPGETETTVNNTIDFLNDTRPTLWRAQAWWGNPKSPIYAKQEEYGISGSAYKWAHDTMTSEEAAALCDAMYSSVVNSAWLPLYDFDFWSLPYLAGKGLSVNELVPLLELSQEIMQEQQVQREDGSRLKILCRELADAVAALSLDSPRFSYTEAALAEITVASHPMYPSPQDEKSLGSKDD